MRPRRLAYLAVILLSAPAYPVQAQEITHVTDERPQTADSLLRRNAASILFDRNLNTYNWIGRTAIDTTIGGTLFGLTEQYSSNIIVTEGAGPSGKKKLQSNQQDFAFRIAHPVAADLSPVAQWSSFIYSDDKGVGLSNASIHSLLAGVTYDPLPFVTLNPMAGYRWDDQADIRDKGLTYNIAARLKTVDVDGYQFDGGGQLHEDRLDPRTLESHFARMGVQKSFSGLARDSLEFGVRRTRREFYALADSNIESRIENILTFSNLLEYQLDNNLGASVFLNVSSRGLDKDLRSFGATAPSVPQFNTRIDEFRIDTYVQATYRADDGVSGASARLSYSERDESHLAKPIAGAPPNVAILFSQQNEQEQTKDNLSRRTSLAGTASIPISTSDRFFLSGAASILRYDTPSLLNVEDRDELLVALTLATLHRISRFFEIGVSLDGNFSHVVYLLKERSANNNINRVLRLSPRTTYRPTGWLATTNVFEVLANYTVYDFEQQLALVRSFSYRQFGWSDSTSIELTDRVGLDFFAYLKLYERGQLRWNEFKERTENSFADKSYAFQARFVPAPGTIFAVGLRYFSQARYAYGDAGKALDSFLSSVGPTCVILWEIGPNSQFGLHGWYEHRKQQDGTTHSIASMTMNIVFNF